MSTVISRLMDVASRIKDGKHEKIKPGHPEHITAAASPNDFVRQGDLYLVVLDRLPADGEKVTIPVGNGEVREFVYREVTELTPQDAQLVPGNTQGSRHCLDSLDGVKMLRPEGWGPDWEEVAGPIFGVTEDRTVEHPRHGPIKIDKGLTIGSTYQRMWDQEQKRERRQID